MDDTILAYMAGIIDGEGSIMINGSNHKQQSVVSVANTSELLIKWIVTHFGGHTNIEYSENVNHKNRYWWRLYGYSMKPFLESILPYLVIKKPQAELMLELFKILLPIGGRSHPTDEYWIARDEFVDKMHQLNKRGR